MLPMKNIFKKIGMHLVTTENLPVRYRVRGNNKIQKLAAAPLAAFRRRSA